MDGLELAGPIMSWLSSHGGRQAQIWLVCVVAFEPQHGCVTVLILFHAPVPFLQPKAS